MPSPVSRSPPRPSFLSSPPNSHADPFADLTSHLSPTAADRRARSVVPMLEQEYAVEKILSAILVNQKLLIMPRLFYLSTSLKNTLPTDVIDYVYEKLGGQTFMSKFVGRAKTK